MSGGEISLSVLIRIAAEQARRDAVAFGGDIKAIGTAAEEAGRKSATAGQAMQQTGTAMQQASASATLLNQGFGESVNQQINFAAATGRTATAIGGFGVSAQSLNQHLRAQIATMVDAAQESAAYRGELGQIRAMINPLSAALAQYEGTLEAVTLAEEMGAISAREAAVAHDGLARAMMEVRERASAAGISLDSLGPAMAPATTAIQRLIERNAGLGAATASSTASTLQQGHALDQLRAKYNPLFAASQQYELQLREIAEAERLQAISAAEAANARARAAQAIAPMNTGLMQLGQNSRAAGAHAANLSFQLNDIFMMTAVGQSPWMLMMQQGPQMAQIMGQLRQQGLSLGDALRTAMSMVLNPAGLATMAVIGLGAAGVQWLMSLQGETKSFDDRLGDLNETLGRMRSNLDLLGNRRAAETFGSLTAEVRALTEGLLQLDRAAQPRQMQAVIDSFLGEEVAEGWGSRMLRVAQSGLLMGTRAPPPRAGEHANYAALGVANTYDDFRERTRSIRDAAGAGDIAGVVRQVEELRAAMAGNDAGAGLSGDVRTLIKDISELAVRQAEIEARWNGSAQAEAIARQIDQMVQGYRQQTELAEASVRFGEGSAEVEAVRARHAREILDVRLEEMDVQQGSLEHARAHAALEAAQTAEADAARQRREQGHQQMIADLMRQSELSTAILTHGEDSARLEEIRARHARDILQARLEEMGMAPAMIAQAQALAEAERQRQLAIRAQATARRAGDMLAELREEAAIGRAIVLHGRDSVEVRRLQIEADRRAYELSLDTMRVTAATRAELMAAWDIARGMGQADPFGQIASAQDYLRAQRERIEDLRLEQSLIGQTEEIRRRALALMEAERDMRRQNIDATSVYADQIRTAALAEADLALQVERQRTAWQSAQRSAEEAIDGIIEKLSKGDIEGALEGLAGSITGMMLELAVANPLKNAMFGTNHGTLQDVGGLGGLIGRMFGRDEAPDLAARAVQSSVASMQVTAANVMINGAGVAAMAGIGGAANIPAAPASQDALRFLQSIATGGALRPDGITGLHAGLANPLAQLIQEAQGQFGPNAVSIFSGYRSNETQARLWESALERYGSPEAARRWVAPPGSSRHNAGLAADLRYGSPQIQSWMHQNAGRYGLGYRMGHEPWHIEPTNASALMGGQGLPTVEFQHLGQVVTTAAGQVAGLGTEAGQAESAFANLMQRGLGPLGQALPGAAGQSVGTMQVNAGQVMVAGGMAGMTGAPGAGGGGGFFSSLIRMIFPGFEGGGPTGGSSPSEVRGVVHGMEYVFDAASTARIGVDTLDALRNGSLKGYRDGGYVSTAAPAIMRNSAVAAAAQPPAVIQLQPVLVNNTSTQMEVETEETTDARGQRQQKYILSDAVAEGLATPGGRGQRTMSQVYNVNRAGRRRQS